MLGQEQRHEATHKKPDRESLLATSRNYLCLCRKIGAALLAPLAPEQDMDAPAPDYGQLRLRLRMATSKPLGPVRCYSIGWIGK
jgi:hypothetical protein